MKYYGLIGYAVTVETAPGVWEEQITERTYCGDVTRRTSRTQNNNSNLNDDLEVSNTVSMVADPYALEHLGDIRYITFANSKWKVTSVEYNYPRLILSVGGVYNAKEQA